LSQKLARRLPHLHGRPEIRQFTHGEPLMPAKTKSRVTSDREQHSMSSCEGSCAEQNVGESERMVSLGVGAMMALWGIGRGGLSGLLATGLGAGLLYRGATGHCPVYSALDVDSAGKALMAGIASLGEAAEKETKVLRRSR
jgi:hypothetical protein